MKQAIYPAIGVGKVLRSDKLLPLAVALLLYACGKTHNVGYSRYSDVPQQGWDSGLTFAFDPEETDSMHASKIYDVVVNVRYTADYPYRELWLKIEEFSQENGWRTDTVQLYLTNEYGRQTGRGRLGLYSLADTIHRNYRLPDGYHVEIGHAMADECVEGVKNIGVTLLRK